MSATELRPASMATSPELTTSSTPHIETRTPVHATLTPSAPVTSGRAEISVSPAELDRIRPQRFSTLVRVEFRKMTDTRSGKVLIAAIFAVALLILGWKLIHTGSIEPGFENYLEGMQAGVGFVLPVVGLLAMTSEWTQRTALTTFTMSPRRLRVIAAKFVSALGLSLAVLITTIGLTAAATWLGGVIGGHGASFAGAGSVLRPTIVASMAQVVMAAAFGALIPVTAVAIACFLAFPAIWASVGPTVLKDSSSWFDIFGAYDRLGSAHPWTQLSHTLTSVVVWVALPLAIGVYRTMRREVK